MLDTGKPIPSFSLESDAGPRVASADLLGAWCVFYFYPKADTPGCTREAQAFTALAHEFRARGVRVFGISKDTTAALCKFRAKYELGVELLADPELVVHRAFGAFGEKTMYGKRVEGVIRSTFVVDPTGVVRHVFPNVKVDGHAERVLQAVDELRTSGGRGPAEPAPTNAERAPRKRAAPKEKARARS